MDLNLSSFTVEQIAALKSQLDAITSTDGRSPFKSRQLTDLRLLPTKDDPRPTFFMSAEAPRNAGDLTRTTLYPRLMWHGETGAEITVTDARSFTAHLERGYVELPPFEIVLDPMDALAAQIDALSADDREALIESQRQDRIGAMRQKLAALSEDKLAILLGQAEAPAKRGPGRPKKEHVA
jgi:hypothetical protein